jgi:hypothetical protein
VAPRAASVTAHAGGSELSTQYEHHDVLIVISKMKKYIRDRSGTNTPDAVANALGDHVRSTCEQIHPRGGATAARPCWSGTYPADGSGSRTLGSRGNPGR